MRRSDIRRPALFSDWSARGRRGANRGGRAGAAGGACEDGGVCARALVSGAARRARRPLGFGGLRRARGRSGDPPEGNGGGGSGSGKAEGAGGDLGDAAVMAAASGLRHCGPQGPRSPPSGAEPFPAPPVGLQAALRGSRGLRSASPPHSAFPLCGSP